MDLTTRYLGLTLNSPLVASAGPVTGEVDNIRRLEDLGAGAVVLPSIFEEQITHEEKLLKQLSATGTDSYSESLTFFPSATTYSLDPDRYLELLRRSAQAVDVPVVASLNCITGRGWIKYARQLEQAGASALELNIYFIPADPSSSGIEVENRYVSILEVVKQTVKIPVAVELSPYFSSTAHMAAKLSEAGADGLVLFNRFYEPDIDLVRLARFTISSSARPPKSACRSFG